MQRDGASAREIADALQLSHKTILQWLEDTGQKPNGGGGPRKSRSRKETPAPLVDAASKFEELNLPAGPTENMSPLEHTRARLAQVTAMLEQLANRSNRGESTSSDFRQLANLERDLRSELAGYMPRDGAGSSEAEDEGTVADASEVVRKIRNTVDAARKAARCASCGKNPYGLEARR